MVDRIPVTWAGWAMAGGGVLRRVDAVTVRVSDIDSGLRFYVEQLGHELKWRNDEVGQAGLALPDGRSELVLTTEHQYEPNWLVDDVELAIRTIVEHGGTVVVEPFDIPVGHVGVVLDPFGNSLVLIDLSKGTYDTDSNGSVTGVS